ncbi:MAG: hypothetical protein K8T89_07980 [Planctomycetes bacterium]|nr:hypothetical protein [Planctomycetota bacterium]
MPSAIDKSKTVEYWNQVRTISVAATEYFRLKRTSTDAAERCRELARRIEQLPIVGVDAELVGFGNKLRSTLREFDRLFSDSPSEMLDPNFAAVRQRLEALDSELAALRLRLTQSYGVEFGF